MAKRELPKPADSIDWNEIQRRLETSRMVIERGAERTPEEKEQILKARARSLAREHKEKEDSEEHLDIVAFLLAYEQYGIESSYVREVYPLKELAPLPCTPPFVLGIINVRGRILSIIDLKKFFDLPEKGLTDLNKVIILHTERMEFGILADAILGVRSIQLAEIQPPLPTFTGIRAVYLRGVTKERLAILDVVEMLADTELIVHEEVET